MSNKYTFCLDNLVKFLYTLLRSQLHLAGSVSCLSSARNIETHKASHRVKGRAFDHFLQIWFENEVKTFKQAT